MSLTTRDREGKKENEKEKEQRRKQPNSCSALGTHPLSSLIGAKLPPSTNQFLPLPSPRHCFTNPSTLVLEEERILHHWLLVSSATPLTAIRASQLRPPGSLKKGQQLLTSSLTIRQLPRLPNAVLNLIKPHRANPQRRIVKSFVLIRIAASNLQNLSDPLRYSFSYPA